MQDVTSLIRSDILRLEGYTPEVHRAKIKLDANECPYNLFKTLNLRGLELNRYPDPQARLLKERVSRLWDTEPENLLQGNGSDELIYYLISITEGPVLYPVPTFSMYGIIARVLGRKPLEIPLDENFDISQEDFIKKIKEERPGIIFLSSPNNPTGNSFSRERIMSIVESAGSLVVVDEAYQAYAQNGNGFIPYTKRYKNLVVMRTFSKIGLAGLRLGFVIGNRLIINELNKARLPYNVNTLTQFVVLEALKKNLFKDIVKKIISERERLMDGLKKIDGVVAYPSHANFILFRIKDNGSGGSAADRVYRRLLKKGIVIKNLTGLLPGCLRVTVGRPQENSAFLRALKEVL